jgi:DUF2897 family protein
MNWVFWIILIISLGMIVSPILLLKQSAKKFNLSEQQLKDIKERNKALDAEEELDK